MADKPCNYCPLIIFLFSFLSVTLLFFTSVSPLAADPIVEAQFINVNDLGIGTFQGVTQISFGIWSVCYSSLDGAKMCTPITVGGYTFNIVNNESEINATVKLWWSQAFVTGPFACIWTFIATCLLLLYYRLGGHDRFQQNFPRLRSWVNSLMLLTWLIISVAFILYEVVVFPDIRNTMQSLAPGGITTVVVKQKSGHWLVVAAFGSFSLAFLTQLCNEGLGLPESMENGPDDTSSPPYWKMAKIDASPNTPFKDVPNYNKLFYYIAHDTMAYLTEDFKFKPVKTTYHRPSKNDAFLDLEHNNGPPDRPKKRVNVEPRTTLKGAAEFYEHYIKHEKKEGAIGVLNFANATKPGGDFMDGAMTPEAAFCRSSNLIPQLRSFKQKERLSGDRFYTLHKEDNPYHSDAIICSENISIFRKDDGSKMEPYNVNMVTCAAVNASKLKERDGDHYDTEDVTSKMKNRMALVLNAFISSRSTWLVLGNFEAEVFEDNVETCARLWGELLSSARFKDVFDHVVFFIPGEACNDFRNALYRILYPGEQRYIPPFFGSYEQMAKNLPRLDPLKEEVKKKHHRELCRLIAHDTLAYLDEALDLANPDPTFHPPTEPEVLRLNEALSDSQPPVEVDFQQITTLQGAYKLRCHDHIVQAIGVLNFANATTPGGGFKNGATAQEESIARSSDLYLSLEKNLGSFYKEHSEDDPYYSDAVIYCPNITIFRDDNGAKVNPYRVDILTCAAVNARKVIEKEGNYDHIKKNVSSKMFTRMARILYRFRHKGIRHLVLGSFGTGVFGNDVEECAKSWGTLLSSPAFKTAFEKVLFAIPDDNTFRMFEPAFNTGKGIPVS